MEDMIDPASDYVFNATGTVISEKGIVETEPKTDDDWARVRVGAVTLAEGIYLLKIPRPIAPPGAVNNSSAGPDSSELAPDQIKARIEADPVLWNAKIEALRNISLEVLEIVKRKDAKELLGGRRDSRPGLRDLPPRILVSSREGSDEEAGSPSDGPLSRHSRDRLGRPRSRRSRLRGYIPSISGRDSVRGSHNFLSRRGESRKASGLLIHAAAVRSGA